MSKHGKFVIRSYVEKQAVYLQPTSSGMFFGALETAFRWNDRKKISNALRTVKGCSRIDAGLKNRAEIVLYEDCVKNDRSNASPNSAVEREENSVVNSSGLNEMWHAVDTLLGFYASEKTLNKELSDADKRLQDIEHDIENHKGDFAPEQAIQVCERLRSIRIQRRSVKMLLELCGSMGSMKKSLQSLSDQLSKGTEYRRRSDEPNLLNTL